MKRSFDYLQEHGEPGVVYLLTGMWNFFKRRRTKLLEWEAPLLIAVFNKLSPKYDHLANQISEGIISRIHFHPKFDPNYVGFGYNPELSQKYEVESGEFYKLSGITFRDIITDRRMNIEIYAAAQLIMGYSMPGHETVRPDILSVDVSKVFQKNFVEGIFFEIKSLFSKEELKLINRSNVYEIEIKEMTLYHIFDLEDGDFVAIDRNKKIYEVTHDPYQAKVIEKPLLSVLLDRKQLLSK